DALLVEREAVDHRGRQASGFRLGDIHAVRFEDLGAGFAQLGGRRDEGLRPRLRRYPPELVARRPRRAPERAHPLEKSARHFALRRAHRKPLSYVSTRSSRWIISSRPR